MTRKRRAEIPRGLNNKRRRKESMNPDDYIIGEATVEHKINTLETDYDTNELIVSLNCNSLNDETLTELCRFLKEIAQARKPALILLQETKLSTKDMWKVEIVGYRVIKTSVQPMNVPRHYRGSMILVSEEHNADELNTYGNESENVELIGVKLLGTTSRTWKQEVHVWNLYNPPYSASSSVTLNCIKSLVENRGEEKLMIIGDFNCNIKSNPDKARGGHIEKWILEAQINQEIYLVNDHEDTTSRNSIVDLAISSHQPAFAAPIHHNLHSDHYPLVVGFEQEVDTEDLPTERIKYRRDDEMATILKSKCRELANRAASTDMKQDDLAYSILNIWKSTARKREPKKKQSTKNKQQSNQHSTLKKWWNEELEVLYKQKQALVSEIDKRQFLLYKRMGGSRYDRG